MGERRENLMVVIQEFDLDIKPTKIVRGKGLCKLVMESQDLIDLENYGWDNKISLWCSEVLYIPPGKDSWYGNLSFFLHHGTCPKHLKPREKRDLRLKFSHRLLNFLLFCMN